MTPYNKMTWKQPGAFHVIYNIQRMGILYLPKSVTFLITVPVKPPAIVSVSALVTMMPVPVIIT